LREKELAMISELVEVPGVPLPEVVAAWLTVHQNLPVWSLWEALLSYFPDNDPKHTMMLWGEAMVIYARECGS
jgi:hypothetical protein